MGLAMYTFDDEEWVIANSEFDARDIYSEHFGVTPDYGIEPSDDRFYGTHADHWERLPDDRVLEFRQECPEIHSAGKIAKCPRGCDKDFILHFAKTCAEWVQERGRGYFGAVEF